MVGHDFEMQEEVRRQAVEEKLQDAQRAVDLQVEGAVDELEVAGATLEQIVQRRQEALFLESPGRLVEGAETELALERAAARGFDVEQAMRQIVGAVLGVGQLDLLKARLFTRDHLHQRRRPMAQGAAQLGETDVTPAGDQVIGQANDFLLFPLMADFRAAKHDLQRRAGRLQQADDFGGRRDIPDIDAEADDLRPAIGRLAQFAKQRLDDGRLPGGRW